jgi:hypothetical protein
MAYPTAVNGQITDIILQHKDKAKEVLDLIHAKDYENATRALEEMIDPEFGLRPARQVYEEE